MLSSKKQKTLFESWKCNSKETLCTNVQSTDRSASTSKRKDSIIDQSQSSVIDLCDDLDDVDLLSVAVAVEQNNDKQKNSSQTGIGNVTYGSLIIICIM